jgi:phage terminase large subunit GpA-like protein
MSSRIASYLREDFAFSTPPKVTEWCEQNLVLPAKMAPASSGPFSIRRRPMMRSILECGHPQSGVRSLTVTGGSQTLKTTSMILVIAYRIAHSPMPTLILGNAEDWLRVEISDKRLGALIEENNALRIHKPFDRTRFRALYMEMSGAPIVFEGINSDTSTSGSTQGIVYICEGAKVKHHDSEQAPEAHPIKLAFERTKEFRGLELQMMDFTPNTPNHIAWKIYERGTQTHFHVPCPHCGHLFPFEFEVKKNADADADEDMESILEAEQDRAVSDTYRSLIWSPDARRADGSWNIDRVRESARYVCPKNGCLITDDDKPGMIDHYQEVHHNANAALSDRSFRIPSFYAPKVSFGDMAKEFLEKGDLITTGLQNFYNSWLGLPWSVMAYNITERHIARLTGTHARRVIPSQPAFTVLTADPGEKATHWAVIAVMPNGDLLYIDWGSVTSERDLIAPDFLKARGYYLAGTSSVIYPSVGYSDSSWNTEEVYDVCDASGGFLWPVKGDPRATGTWNETRAASRNKDVKLYTYSDTQLKDEFYGRRIQKGKGPKIILPTDADMELKTGLMGQMKDRQTNLWKRVQNDHLGDCGKYALLASQIARKAKFIDF